MTDHTMRKIILDLAITLDGFIEGPNGEIDWCIMDEDMNFEAFLDGIDTIFYGRVSYDMWGAYQPGSDATEIDVKLSNAIHAKKKYVFSSQPQEDEGATFISTDIPATVAKNMEQPGKDIWLYGGASLIKTFIREGLVDRYQLSVHPVALGNGKPLFEDMGQRLNLKLIKVNTFRSGVAQLVYEPV
jgi:dihydrofolate reductase